MAAPAGVSSPAQSSDYHEMMFVQWPLAKTFPVGDAGMVAAKHPLAAQVGVSVLRSGGTAVDAAIATSLASGVVEPYMSGVGGGGLALYQSRDGESLAFHFGMQAPASARPDMYEIVPGTHDVDLFGWPRTAGDANVSGPTSIAVPGLVPGLHRLWQAAGRLPWRDLVEPARALAADGFPVDWLTSLRTLEGQDLLSRFPASRAIFLARGRPPKPELGRSAEILRQANLGGTLEAVAEDPAAMTGASIAETISRATHGRVTRTDLVERRLLEGQPLAATFDGLEVCAVPWATGGATALEWLGILDALDPPRDEADPRFWSAVIKAGEVAMHDRLEKLGDPGQVPFPAELLDASYHRRMARSIEAGEVGPVSLPPAVGSTSHLAVVDGAGNAVSLTQTLLSLWGSGVTTEGTGICLNNGMMWFDPEPDRRNSIAPNKLPLANMCPLLVRRGGSPYLVYGASGGRRIMPALVQILLRVSLFGRSLPDAMAAPRIDLSTEEVRVDVRFGDDFLRRLAPLVDRPLVARAPILGSSPWASPVGLMRLDHGRWTGGADPFTMACVEAA